MQGLIGINGAGKSTFLKCLAKEMTADSGNIESPSNTNVVYVEQDRHWPSATCVYEAIFADKTKRAAAVRRFVSLSSPAYVSVDGEDPDAALLRAIEQMDETGAWVSFQPPTNCSIFCLPWLSYLL